MSDKPAIERTDEKSVALKIHGALSGRPAAGEDSDALSAAVAGCRLHDRQMQRQLYDLCHEKAYRLCARMVGMQDADDVCQQTFLKVFQSIEHFAGRSSFMAELSDTQRQQIIVAIYANRKIEAIRLHRAATSSGLRESKEFIEELQARLWEEMPEKFVSPPRSGCVGSAAIVLIGLGALYFGLQRLLG